MKPHPISMTARSVRDIYAGHKTVTRRPWCGVNRYGQAGGLLWVREQGQVIDIDQDARRVIVLYNAKIAGGELDWRPMNIPADYTGKTGTETGPVRSMFMPKWMARLWLRVEDIRVERLTWVNKLEARLEGYDTVADFRKAWRDIYGNFRQSMQVQRIQFQRIQFHITEKSCEL